MVNIKSHPLLLYGLVVFCWSTSWLPLKWQTLENVEPLVSVFWRFAFASVIMVLIAIWQGARLGGYSIKNHLQFLALGFFLFSNNFSFFLLR